MTTITEAKDKAAREFGYEDYSTLIKKAKSKYTITELINRSLEIYAEAKAKEFAEWILVEGFEKYQDNGDCWWGKFNEEKDYSTEQLYKNYNQNG